MVTKIRFLFYDFGRKSLGLKLGVITFKKSNKNSINHILYKYKNTTSQYYHCAFSKCDWISFWRAGTTSDICDIKMKTMAIWMIFWRANAFHMAKNALLKSCPTADPASLNTEPKPNSRSRARFLSFQMITTCFARKEIGYMKLWDLMQRVKFKWFHTIDSTILERSFSGVAK